MTSTSTEGRRRADVIEATRPADPWDHARPMDNPEPGRPRIDDALGYAVDRLDRLEHVLGDLNGVVMRAGAQLEPILTAGTYADPDGEGTAAELASSPTPEDRRSTIARRIASTAERTDALTDAAIRIRHRLEAILEAVEL